MDFQMGRGREGPAAFLKGYRGKLQSDGYVAYDKLGEGIVYVACAAHIRRGFVDAMKVAPLDPRSGWNKGASLGRRMAIAGAGIGFAWHVYRRREGLADAMANGFGPVYTLVRNLFWVDEMYEAFLLKPFYRLSRWFTGFDKWVVDGLVNASGIVTEITGQIVKLFQTGYVRNYALAILIGAIAVVYYFVTL